MRAQLGHPDDQAAQVYVTNGRNGNLNAYSADGFRVVVDALRQQRGPKAADVLRAFTSSAENCPLDKQGRIALSQPHRDAGGIQPAAQVLLSPMLDDRTGARRHGRPNGNLGQGPLRGLPE